MRAAPHLKPLLAAFGAVLCLWPASGAAAAPLLPASRAAFTVRAACPPAGSWHVHCDALELVPRAQDQGAPETAVCHPPQAIEGCYGLRPQDIHAAYDLPAQAPTPQTIAIVSAGKDPTASRDLGVYDTIFGLPACTRENHCLTILNGSGERKPLPPNSSEAARETSIDLQVAHAVCPNCSLVLVEAASNSLPPSKKPRKRRPTCRA